MVVARRSPPVEVDTASSARTAPCLDEQCLERAVGCSILPRDSGGLDHRAREAWHPLPPPHDHSGSEWSEEDQQGSMRQGGG